MATTSNPTVGLLRACDDARLFGFPLWPKQRELLAALERGPRLHVWALGRRSGKTTTGALAALHSCLFRPDLDAKVRPGERRYAVGVATNLRQARLFVNAAASIVERSPLLHDRIESRTEDELVFRNGAVLTAFPCSSRGGRGWPISFLFMDEAAFFLSETEGPQVADRVLNSLVPSAAQFGDGARIVVSSTPWGMDGLFAQLYQQALSGELPDAEAHHATTREANPTVDEAWLAQEAARDPESFRSEYLADFIGSGAAFLDPDKITDAIADRAALLPEHATNWVAGLDPAFSSDPFGLALVGSVHTDRGRLVLGLVQKWVPPRRKAASLEERREIEDRVLDEVAQVCLRYKARVVTDQFAATAIVDRLRRRGLSVRTEAMTSTSKTAAFSELRARLNLGTLELYEHPDLIAELRRLRTKYSAGSSTVVNPRVGGSHGDLAQALALAVYEHDRHGIAQTSTRAQEEPVPGQQSITAKHARELDGPRRTPRYFDPPGLGMADRIF